MLPPSNGGIRRSQSCITNTLIRVGVGLAAPSHLSILPTPTPSPLPFMHFLFNAYAISSEGENKHWTQTVGPQSTASGPQWPADR